MPLKPFVLHSRLRCCLAGVAVLLLGGLLFAGVPTVGAQSTQAEAPAPISAGVNRGTLDSFVGDHFWTVWVNPGSFQIRFAPGNPQEMVNMGMRVEFLAMLKPKTLGATLSRKDLPGGAVVYSGSTPKRIQVVIGISPPNSKLVRQSVGYTLEATGSADFANAPAAGSAPRVVGVYGNVMNGHGSAKFLPNGDIITTNGEHGHWELFDAGSRTYVITIGRDRWDAIFQPGRGFVQPNGTLLMTLPQQ